MELEEKISIEMKLCAYTIQCEGLSTDFVDKQKDIEENILYKNNGSFYSYYSVPNAEEYLMKVMYPKQKYWENMDRLEKEQKKKFLLYSIFSLVVSLLFSFYALMPLRRALRLNEEFVKDILHDFNTPLSSMKINLKLFVKEIGRNPKIERLENNIETILSLQDNLQTFLKGSVMQTETFDLNALMLKRVAYFGILYPDIDYNINIRSVQLHTNKDAFTRIVDNLLSNAGKYNKKEGTVSVALQEDKFIVQDTGKGIAAPSKVFDRYYKEQDRGIGIGLHIVKKLCDELKIKIRMTSVVGKGTKVILYLSPILV